jgi:hypothetical protein
MSVHSLARASDIAQARVHLAAAHRMATLHELEERDRLFFEAMMRIVDRELPGYRD